MLKPKGAPAVKIVLTSIDEGRSFSDCTNFFGAKMVDTHAMIETPYGLLISNTLVVSGPLQWLWIKLVAQNVADKVLQELGALVKVARAKHG